MYESICGFCFRQVAIAQVAIHGQATPVPRTPSYRASGTATRFETGSTESQPLFSPIPYPITPELYFGLPYFEAMQLSCRQRLPPPPGVKFGSSFPGPVKQDGLPELEFGLPFFETTKLSSS